LQVTYHTDIDKEEEVMGTIPVDPRLVLVLLRLVRLDQKSEEEEEEKSENKEGSSF